MFRGVVRAGGDAVSAVTTPTPTAADFGRARVRLAMQRAVQETRRALVWERGEDGRAGDASYYEAACEELAHFQRIVADDGGTP